MVDEKSKEGKRLYWRVCRKEDPNKTGITRYKYPIECKAITESDEASNFYLRPFSQGKGEKYFYIVTDPEDDVKSSAEVELKHQAATAKPEPEHGDAQASTKSGQVFEPQRYIQINPKTNRLEAVLVVRKHKDHSAFKLKNPQDDKTYSLARSQWLPESSLGSQPYIICCKGKSLESWGNTKSVCVEKYDTFDTKSTGVKDDHKGRGNKKEGNMNGESSQDGNERGDNVENGDNADDEVENDSSINNRQDDEEGNDSKKDQRVKDSQASHVKSKANNEYIITYRECALSEIPFSDRLFIIERGHKT